MVLASSPRSRIAAFPLSISLFVGAGACIRDLPELPPRGEGAELTGQALGLDPRLDAEVPLEGVLVRVRGTGVSALSDASGHFVLGRLPLGRYVLELSAVSDWNEPLALRIDGVALEVDGLSRDLGTQRLGALGGLEGTIELKSEASSFVAPGAIVQAIGTRALGVTDPSGRWRIPRLAPGPYDLSASFAGYRPGLRRDVPVASQLELRVASFELEPLEPGAPIEVAQAVVDESAQGLEGVRIRALDASSAEVAVSMSDGQGQWRMELVPGAYRVEFRQDGFRSVALDGVVVLPPGVVGLSRVVLSPSKPGDADGDGVPDGEDRDSDNDGVPDDQDVAPLDPTRGRDLDGDGIADEVDDDADGDGLGRLEELSEGMDGWRTDPLDADTDDDGHEDGVDVCPTVPDDQSDADGDGVGDACTSGLGTAARVDGFEPAAAGPGQVVIVRGAGFSSDRSEIAVRFGDEGQAVRPDAASPNELSVTVPERSSSGPVVVYGPGGTARSGTAFCFDPSPSVDAIGFPTSARAGAAISVVGLGLSAPACSPHAGDVVQLVVTSSSGGRVAVDPSGPVQAVVEAGRLRQQVGFTLPSDAASGSASVERSGSSSDPFELELESSALSIHRLEPAEVGPGDRVSIHGAGFAIDGGRGELELPGLRRPLTVHASSDALIRFVVPAGVMDGQLTLRVGGDLVASAPFVVRDGSIELVEVDPPILRSRERYRFEGRNFPVGDVVMVRFPGHDPETVLLETSTNFEITLYESAEPGPIELEFSDGTLLTTASLPAHEDDVFLDRSLNSAVVETTIAGELFVLSRDSYTVRDPMDGAVLDGPYLNPLLTGSGDSPAALSRQASSDRAAFLTSAGRFGVVELGTMAIVGSGCTLSGVSSLAKQIHVASDDGSAMVVSGDGVARVSFSDGACRNYPLPSSDFLSLAPVDAQHTYAASATGVYAVDLSGSTPQVQSVYQGALALRPGLVFDAARQQLWFPLVSSTVVLDLSGSLPARTLPGMGFPVGLRRIDDYLFGPGVSYDLAGLSGVGIPLSSTLPAPVARPLRLPGGGYLVVHFTNASLQRFRFLP